MSSTGGRSRVCSRARSSGRLIRNGFGEELALRGLPIERVRALEQADLEDLPRIVPLVHGVADVEAFVALQPDQLRAEHGRQHLRDLGLADARLAFEEERPLKLEREKHRHRQRRGRRRSGRTPCACCRSSTDASAESLPAGVGSRGPSTGFTARASPRPRARA